MSPKQSGDVAAIQAEASRRRARANARRIRRGRQPGSQAGQGHGEPIYVRVRVRNAYATASGRTARAEILFKRAERDADQLNGLRARVAKTAAATKEAA